MPTQTEIQSEITARIIEGLKQGVVPWRKPWRNDPNSGAPVNVVSKRNYSGINPLLLDLVSMTRGYTSRWWGTYQQWASLGAQVKKRPDDVPPGRWGTSVVFWKQIKTTEQNEDGGGQSKTFPLLRYFTVFNLEQVEGENLEHLWASNGLNSSPLLANYEPAQEAIKATGADFRFGSNRAYYVRPVGEWPNHTDGDYICLPHRDRFTQPNEYYATVFHELIHWSEIRLGWTGSYALGELVAEIGGLLPCAQSRVPCSDDLSNHTAYLASWLKELQSDPKAMLRAASQASKAADFVLSLSRRHEHEVTQ